MEVENEHLELDILEFNNGWVCIRWHMDWGWDFM